MRNIHDIQSVIYLLLFPSLILFQWQLDSIHWILYSITCILTLGISSINHNIGHVPMWTNRRLNMITEYIAGTLQGAPLFLFKTVHIDSHHRYNQGEEDATRVARAGDHNHLIGYITYPALFCSSQTTAKMNISIAYPLLPLPFEGHHSTCPVVYSCGALALSIDWQQTFILIIVPQLIGIHFLMASNYLQHAHCEVGSEFNHSRNFTGKLFNLLFLNVGYHTAHHLERQSPLD